MNDEKKIARAILDAFWLQRKNCNKLKSYQEALLDLANCLEVTCGEQGLSSDLWHLLALAATRPDDIRYWAEEILAE